MYRTSSEPKTRNSNGVDLSLVNPYNTSKIANNKYCYDMKLNIHSGASYVIARRFYELD